MKTNAFDDLWSQGSPRPTSTATATATAPTTTPTRRRTSPAVDGRPRGQRPPDDARARRPRRAPRLARRDRARFLPGPVRHLRGDSRGRTRLLLGRARHVVPHWLRGGERALSRPALRPRGSSRRDARRGRPHRAARPRAALLRRRRSLDARPRAAGPHAPAHARQPRLRLAGRSSASGRASPRSRTSESTGSTPPGTLRPPTSSLPSPRPFR